MFQQAQKKPYSAVTVSIDTLTSEAYDEDDLSGIPDLVEVISLQASGPGEAARAIRKKLKYGNTHRQLRALALLDGLVQNAGPRFQRALAADEPLLERLRVCAASELSDPEVRRRCRELFGSWARQAGSPGLERIARLHRELPKRKVMPKQETSRVIRETENPFGDDEDNEGDDKKNNNHNDSGNDTASHAGGSGGAGPSSRSRGPSLVDGLRGQHRTASATSLFGLASGDKKRASGDKDKGKGKGKDGKGRPFSLEAEKEQMKTTIADASLAATNLLNAVQSINRERERISQNKVAVERFEACKQLRRKVLRYIHHVSHEQWLGPLLHANDELVHALMTFEQLDQSVDADSDSDDELAEQAHLYRMVAARGKKEEAERVSSPTPADQVDVSGLSLKSASPPPTPLSPASSGHRPAPPPRPPRPSVSSPPRQVPKQGQHHVSWGAPAKQPPKPADEDDDDGDPFADCNTVE
ncbi:Protein lsb5 [Escovopsis weberi]|uniref:Protein lsb5 n=1 Tax=Escovopsis weberi TaxID=150374 RepID=A0A0M8MZA0_ESCWE|nr:Protein lsb5 [Escovopsis weberi]